MILVTGVSGFVGKHLITELIEEFGAHNVVALTSKPVSACRYLLHSDYTFDKYFFENAGLSSIRTIIHGGAYTPKNTSQANDWTKCNSNIFTTQVLLGSSLPRLEKFVFLSSVDVYGNTSIVREDSAVNPVSLYGLSKFYGERMTESAIGSDRICQVLRLGHVYGPGEDAYQKVIPVTMANLARNQPLKLIGTGNEIRSFIYVKDVVKGIVNCIKLDKPVGVVNLASSQGITIAKLFDQLLEITGKKVDIEPVPTSTQGRDVIFDNTKMKLLLVPEETPLHVGLAEEWKYIQEKYL